MILMTQLPFGLDLLRTPTRRPTKAENSTKQTEKPAETSSIPETPTPASAPDQNLPGQSLPGQGLPGQSLPERSLSIFPCSDNFGDPGDGKLGRDDPASCEMFRQQLPVSLQGTRAALEFPLADLKATGKPKRASLSLSLARAMPSLSVGDFYVILHGYHGDGRVDVSDLGIDQEMTEPVPVTSFEDPRLAEIDITGFIQQLFDQGVEYAGFSLELDASSSTALLAFYDHSGPQELRPRLIVTWDRPNC